MYEYLVLKHLSHLLYGCVNLSLLPNRTEVEAARVKKQQSQAHPAVTVTFGKWQPNSSQSEVMSKLNRGAIQMASKWCRIETVVKLS